MINTYKLNVMLPALEPDLDEDEEKCEHPGVVYDKEALDIV